MANSYLTRTVSSTGNRRTFTISTWFKRSGITGANQKIFEAVVDGSSYSDLRLKTTEALQFYTEQAGISKISLVTNRLFRDPNAFYHVVIAVDTTQGTASDRVKMYINGVQETSFSTATYPDQNYDTYVNYSSATNVIGRRNPYSDFYFDGLMSHFHLVDGTALAPTVFGSTDSDTGEWKINTSPSYTVGTNGFFILKDTNSGTDQSANSNNFTVGGGTLTKTEDCPSNVFATLNPLSTMIGGSYTFTNGNTTSEQDISRGAISNLGMTSGKFYAEAKFISTSGTNCVIGICGINNTSNQNPGLVASGYIYDQDGTKGNNDSNSSFGDTYTTGDIIGIAVDLDNNKIYFSKNGVWQNSGVPTSGSTGTGAAYTISAASSTPDGAYFFAWSDIHSTAKASWNFGNGYFGTTAVSSNSGNGYSATGSLGIFQYQPPTSYTALCTKGLNL